MILFQQNKPKKAQNVLLIVPKWSVVSSISHFWIMLLLSCLRNKTYVFATKVQEAIIILMTGHTIQLNNAMFLHNSEIIGAEKIIVCSASVVWNYLRKMVTLFCNQMTEAEQVDKSFLSLNSVKTKIKNTSG